MIQEDNKNTDANVNQQVIDAQPGINNQQNIDKQQKTASTTQAEQHPTSYAVRPEHRHHRRIAFSDQNNMLQIRNYLNIAFMLLAIVGVILWTQMESNRTPANIVLIIAVATKIAEVCIRLFKK